MSYYPPQYPQQPYPPQYPGYGHQRPPSGVTGLIGASVALAAVGYTIWPIILLVQPLVGRCGDKCFEGIIAFGMIGLPLADILLLVGGILLFLRKMAGPIMVAVGGFIVLAFGVWVLIISGGAVEPLLMGLLGTILGLTALVMSVLPMTFAWIKAKSQAGFGGYPQQPGYGYPPQQGPYGY